MTRPKSPKTVNWWYREELHTSFVLPIKCAMCGATAIIALPASIADEQRDGTTHVCLPSIGGCNHGFSQ